MDRPSYAEIAAGTDQGKIRRSVSKSQIPAEADEGTHAFNKEINKGRNPIASLGNEHAHGGNHVDEVDAREQSAEKENSGRVEGCVMGETGSAEQWAQISGGSGKHVDQFQSEEIINKADNLMGLGNWVGESRERAPNTKTDLENKKENFRSEDDVASTSTRKIEGHKETENTFTKKSEKIDQPRQRKMATSGG
ncbi:hypothetical protein L6452_43103 [Arctium lappa]|uniref:Uncharacterized protein n=1 Tax=Arctium lappa TaxID=4217 RepID=A0ACB8XJJ3_ARCLA|nr:hypothetical protein L6452_43103 [Arctium lappa]